MKMTLKVPFYASLVEEFGYAGESPDGMRSAHSWSLGKTLKATEWINAEFDSDILIREGADPEDYCIIFQMEGSRGENIFDGQVIVNGEYIPQDLLGAWCSFSAPLPHFIADWENVPQDVFDLWGVATNINWSAHQEALRKAHLGHWCRHRHEEILREARAKNLPPIKPCWEVDIYTLPVSLVRHVQHQKKMAQKILQEKIQAEKEPAKPLSCDNPAAGAFYWWAQHLKEQRDSGG